MDAKINTHSEGPIATVRGGTIEYDMVCNEVTRRVTQTAHTVDGVPITQGLRVFTNNLDRGTVDLAGCTWEWHGPEGVYHLWFYVNVDTNYKGEPVAQRYSQSDDRVIARFNGKSA